MREIKDTRIRCFNPSPGLNVFQTLNMLLYGIPGIGKFQSLTWVERLSDPIPKVLSCCLFLEFQSLTWVERLSDHAPASWLHRLAQSFNPSPGLNVFQTQSHSVDATPHWRFQSLTWVERLSDLGLDFIEPPASISFNPSPGLNVFQTSASARLPPVTAAFQSLTWVERLSDPENLSAGVSCCASFNPSPGLNVFQTVIEEIATALERVVSIPHLG